MKKNYSDIDFLQFIEGETIAYHCYNGLVKKKKNYNEGVDIIANTYCIFDSNFKRHIPSFYKAKQILETDYNVNMYDLPFHFEEVKLDIQKYELLKNLEEYLKSQNIDYSKDDTYLLGIELSKVDINVLNIINEIDNINNKIAELEKIDVPI